MTSIVFNEDKYEPPDVLDNLTNIISHQKLQVGLEPVTEQFDPTQDKIFEETEDKYEFGGNSSIDDDGNEKWENIPDMLIELMESSTDFDNDIENSSSSLTDDENGMDEYPDDLQNHEEVNKKIVVRKRKRLNKKLLKQGKLNKLFDDVRKIKKITYYAVKHFLKRRNEIEDSCRNDDATCKDNETETLQVYKNKPEMEERKTKQKIETNMSLISLQKMTYLPVRKVIELVQECFWLADMARYPLSMLACSCAITRYDSFGFVHLDFTIETCRRNAICGTVNHNQENSKCQEGLKISESQNEVDKEVEIVPTVTLQKVYTQLNSSVYLSQIYRSLQSDEHMVVKDVESNRKHTSSTFHSGAVNVFTTEIHHSYDQQLNSRSPLLIFRLSRGNFFKLTGRRSISTSTANQALWFLKECFPVLRDFKVTVVLELDDGILHCLKGLVSLPTPTDASSTVILTLNKPDTIFVKFVGDEPTQLAFVSFAEVTATGLSQLKVNETSEIGRTTNRSLLPVSNYHQLLKNQTMIKGDYNHISLMVEREDKLHRENTSHDSSCMNETIFKQKILKNPMKRSKKTTKAINTERRVIDNNARMEPEDTQNSITTAKTAGTNMSGTVNKRQNGAFSSRYIEDRKLCSIVENALTSSLTRHQFIQTRILHIENFVNVLPFEENDPQRRNKRRTEINFLKDSIILSICNGLYTVTIPEEIYIHRSNPNFYTRCIDPGCTDGSICQCSSNYEDDEIYSAENVRTSVESTGWEGIIPTGIEERAEVRELHPQTESQTNPLRVFTAHPTSDQENRAELVTTMTAFDTKRVANCRPFSLNFRIPFCGGVLGQIVLSNTCCIDGFLVMIFIELEENHTLRIQFEASENDLHKVFLRVWRDFKDEKFGSGKVTWCRYAGFLTVDDIVLTEEHAGTQNVIDVTGSESDLIYCAFNKTDRLVVKSYCNNENCTTDCSTNTELYGALTVYGSNGEALCEKIKKVICNYIQQIIGPCGARNRNGQRCSGILQRTIIDPPFVLALNLFFLKFLDRRCFSYEIPETVEVCGIRYHLSLVRFFLEGFNHFVDKVKIHGVWTYYDDNREKLYYFEEDPVGSCLSSCYYIRK